MPTEQEIWHHLTKLEDPAFGQPLNVVDVGLIGEVKVTGSSVLVTIMMFNRGRVLIDAAASPIRRHLLELDGVTEASIEAVWEPAWTPDRLSPRAREVLGFTADDPIEGRMHVRAESRADADAPPEDRRHREEPRIRLEARPLPLADLPRDRFQPWWGGWRWYRRITVAERAGIPRRREPVRVDAAFAADQLRDAKRELRVVEEATGADVPCQVMDDNPGNEGPQMPASGCRVSLLFFAAVGAGEEKRFLILHGNPSPAVWPPIHRTDLVTRGEGWALEIDNGIYRARLSPVMGHLRNLEFCRGGQTRLGWDDPIAINRVDASNDPGSKLDIAWHGEDDCIHWNPDFRNQLRYRMTNWPEPPNIEVVRGELCTVVKRWGYPVCPTWPARDQTAVRLEVTYEFFDGLPWFLMSSSLHVEEEADILVVRNDEWLFRQAFSHSLVMDAGGPIRTAPADGDVSVETNPAVVGFFDEDNGDAFVSLRLAYDARGFPGAYDPKLLSMGTTAYGNQIWARDVFHVPSEMVIAPGSFVTETNAYLCFNTADGGLAQASEWHKQLSQPLAITGA